MATSEGITEDLILGGRIRLRQPVDGLRATTDPLLLAAAVSADGQERVLELGSGTGVASLCLSHRVPGCSVVGLEIQPMLVDLAKQNASLNGVTGRLMTLHGDIMAPPSELVSESFDHVMANPPFLVAGDGTLPPSHSKAMAIGEGDATLARWIDLAFKMVRREGTVTFVHRADRLGDLLVGFGAFAGEITLYPLWPVADKLATRLIIRARRGRRTPLRLTPGLILHRPDGRYTEAAENILRDAAAIDM